jgi:hypothetical protein
VNGPVLGKNTTTPLPPKKGPRILMEGPNSLLLVLPMKNGRNMAGKSAPGSLAANVRLLYLLSRKQDWFFHPLETRHVLKIYVICFVYYCCMSESVGHVRFMFSLSICVWIRPPSAIKLLCPDTLMLTEIQSSLNYCDTLPVCYVDKVRVTFARQSATPDPPQNCYSVIMF